MFDLEKATKCAKKMKIYFTTVIQSANVEIPDNIMLKTNEHIIYLFYSCLLDYGMRSKIYHSNLINTHKKHKDLFDPNFIINNYTDNELELFTLIKENICPRYPNIALKKWITLSNFLVNHENLKKEIISLKTYKEVYDFIMSSHSYGQKTGNLLLRLIYESRICPFKDEMKNIPIDRHDVEISYLNGVIKKEKLSNHELEDLGKLWVKAAKNNNLSACDIDKYLWTIGNNLCNKKDCVNCPLNQTCQRKDKMKQEKIVQI